MFGNDGTNVPNEHELNIRDLVRRGIPLDFLRKLQLSYGNMNPTYTLGRPDESHQAAPAPGGFMTSGPYENITKDFEAGKINRAQLNHRLSKAGINPAMYGRGAEAAESAAGQQDTESKMEDIMEVMGGSPRGIRMAGGPPPPGMKPQKQTGPRRGKKATNPDTRIY